MRFNVASLELIAFTSVQIGAVSAFISSISLVKIVVNVYESSLFDKSMNFFLCVFGMAFSSQSCLSSSNYDLTFSFPGESWTGSNVFNDLFLLCKEPVVFKGRLPTAAVPPLDRSF